MVIFYIRATSYLHSVLMFIYTKSFFENNLQFERKLPDYSDSPFDFLVSILLELQIVHLNLFKDGVEHELDLLYVRTSNI